MKIYTYDPQKGQKVECGDLIGDTFYKMVDSRKHFMRNFKAYGISEDAFQKLFVENCQKIKIKETDTGKVWLSNLKDWLDYKFVGNYGAGEQRFYPRAKMTEQI